MAKNAVIKPKQIGSTNSNRKSLRSNRYFVLDTNVLLHDSQSLFAFKGVVVAIPFVVLEELDRFKKESGEMGRNAREVIRTIDDLRSKGHLGDGVELNHGTQGSILKIIPMPKLEDMACLCSEKADNIILHTVKYLVNKGLTVTLVTKDINARVKADALGLEVEDYIKGSISIEEYYTGWTTLQVPSIQLKSISTTKLGKLLDLKELFPNEFIIVESENNTENNKLFRYLGGNNFKEVTHPSMKWSFHSKNIQQLMALDLLMDDSINIVSLLGPAGTGKTFLTLLAGLEKVAHSHIYKRFIISRPVVALGSDIGYLPGDVQEKLHYWMLPIKDNLEYIFSQQAKNNQEEQEQNPKEEEWKYKKHKKKKHHQYNGFENKQFSEIDNLQNRGIISLEAITYMRGRSLPFQFIFIDEVQNLTPHEVKTIVSRAGEGSKVVLAGDPHQIDSPYLDFSSNGLTITSEKFKGQSVFGTVYLPNSERSYLAELAAKIL